MQAENPPAFPNGTFQTGMSLRDKFAGDALVSIGPWMPPGTGGHLGTSIALSARAEWAYRQADAMLAARSGGDHA